MVALSDQTWTDMILTTAIDQATSCKFCLNQAHDVKMFASQQPRDVHAQVHHQFSQQVTQTRELQRQWFGKKN